MNIHRLERDGIVVRLSKVFLVSLLPLLLMVALLFRSSQGTQVHSTRKRERLDVDTSRQDGWTDSTIRANALSGKDLLPVFHLSLSSEDLVDFYSSQVTGASAWMACLQPVLAISKSDHPDPVQPGSTLTYTLTYTNTGTATATGVVVTDILPTEVFSITASVPPKVFDGTLVWHVDTLGPHESGSIVVTAQVTSPLTDGHILTNYVGVDCDRAGSVSEAITTTITSPALAIYKSDHPDPVQPGSTLTYTLTYTNTGTAAVTGVVVTDILPAKVNYITASVPPVVFDGTLVWRIGTLGSRESGSIWFVVKVTSPLTNGHTLANRVDIDCTELAPVSITTTTTITSQPELSISKIADPDPVEPGSMLVYTITYGNTGTMTATGVTITDTLPKGVDFITASASPTASDNPLVWEIGALVPPESYSIVLTVSVPHALPCKLLRDWVEMVCDQTGIVTDTAETQVICTIYFPLILRNFCSACNEGFERRDFSCWVDSGLLNRSVQSQVVDQGDYAALLGSPHYLCQSGVPIGSARIYQFFPVPSCSDPVLSFSYQIRSNDRLQGDRSDSFDVYVNDTLIWRDGNKEWEKANCGRPAWSSGWETFTYDLSDYQGQCIQVTFVNANRESHWYNTWTYLDDVQVTCQP